MADIINNPHSVALLVVDCEKLIIPMTFPPFLYSIACLKTKLTVSCVCESQSN